LLSLLLVITGYAFSQDHTSGLAFTSFKRAKKSSCKVEMASFPYNFVPKGLLCCPQYFEFNFFLEKFSYTKVVTKGMEKAEMILKVKYLCLLSSCNKVVEADRLATSMICVTPVGYYNKLTTV
jgi:hypothetical protein